MCRATLLDSRRSVADIAFAPRSHGLRIATGSSDGFVRIYEAMDVTNLSTWTLMVSSLSHRFQSTRPGGV